MSHSIADNLQDHGIAVYSGHVVSMKASRDPETLRDYVNVGILSSTSLVVQIDVVTGKSRSFYLPDGCEGPRGMAVTIEGHLLVTSVSGHLCRIDPKSGKSWVAATPGKWLWSVDRAADGKFYLGASPGAQLYRYDAVTEKLEDLGSAGFGEMYLRKVVGGDDGYVYCSVGCSRSQIVAYHIASGKFHKLLPKSEETPYFLDTFGHGQDGQLYVQTNTGTGFRIRHGEAFPLKKNHKITEWLNVIEYWVGYCALPDGRRVIQLDPNAIQMGDGKNAKVIPYHYTTGGANIFHLAEGPDKAVYTSTIMPLYLGRYTPGKKKLENLGRGGPDNGEAYSIGHYDGKLYYGNYPSANLMCYDPAKPWHKDPPGRMKWKTNPKWLGYMGKGNCRPRAMSIDSQKRVWVGGVPEYGYRHGGLACYDIRKKKLTVFDEVTKDQSINALAADATGNILYGGTSIGRGGGLEPIIPEARLFAWDTRKKKMAWSFVPVKGTQAIGNLLYRDGKLYGTTASSMAGPNRFTFFRYDPVKRKMDYLVPSEISGAREQSLTFGPDGNLYGVTWMVLFRWRPEDGKIEEIYRCMGEDAKLYGGSLFHGSAAIIDGRFYFRKGPKVMSIHLPLSA